MVKDIILEYAKKLHYGQTRRSGEPYINHVKEVAEVSVLIAEHLIGQYVFLESELDDLYAAGLLHDTIEDTNTDYENIVELANERVAGWVSSISNDKRLPSETRRLMYCFSISVACIEVKILKLADIYSNLKGIVGTEGIAWIGSYLDKECMTLKALSPELKDNEYFMNCNLIIKKLKETYNL